MPKRNIVNKYVLLTAITRPNALHIVRKKPILVAHGGGNSAAVQRYIPEKLRARVNAFNSVLITAGASIFSLLIGFLGEIMDYRWCVTLGGAIAMLASWLLILGRRKEVRRVYDGQQNERACA